MKTKAPTFYWIISSVALLWNAMGCLAYIGQKMMPPEVLEAMSEAERNLHLSTPSWVTAAFAIAVWFGLLGSILLLLRKAMAHPILVISLVGIVVQQFWIFFISDSLEVYGAEQSIMPIVVLLFAIYLIIFTRKAKASNWIN